MIYIGPSKYYTDFHTQRMENRVLKVKSKIDISVNSFTRQLGV